MKNTLIITLLITSFISNCQDLRMTFEKKAYDKKVALYQAKFFIINEKGITS